MGAWEYSRCIAVNKLYLNIRGTYRDASLPTKVGIPTFLRFLQRFPTFSYLRAALNVSPEPPKMAHSNPKIQKNSPGSAPGPHREDKVKSSVPPQLNLFKSLSFLLISIWYILISIFWFSIKFSFQQYITCLWFEEDQMAKIIKNVWKLDPFYWFFARNT